MSSEIIKVPDIGGSEDVEIIEVAVAEGDVIDAEDTLITLESDKASMDVPAPKGGKVVKVLVKEGDTVSEGDDILELEAEGGGEAAADDKDATTDEPAPADAAPAEPEKPAARSGAGASRTVEVRVPDLGGSEDVEIIEVAVAEGDEVAEEDTLITLESDKASMDVPSPYAGKLVSLAVKEGDTVSEGDVIGTMEIAGEGGGEEAAPTEAPAESPAAEAAPEAAAQAAPSGEPERKEIRVPDLSGASDVPIIEVAVSAGDEVNEEDPLITLESDKASMDVPSPYQGKLVELTVKEGDTVSEGDLIGYIETAGAAKPESAAQRSEKPAQAAKADKPAPTPAGTPSPEAQMAAHKPRSGKLVHAGPAVRMLARELGVDLALVKPSGPKERVLKEDVHAYVKQVMAGKAEAPAQAAAAGGGGIPPIPDQDFSQFGEVEEKPMGRLMKMGATNLHRSWVNLPHVTQFDEADITELESFRKSMKAEAEAQGAKLTPLPFLIKACAFALRKFPQFNVSLKADGETVVWKHYVHIGIAVDTPEGLMVPVIRDADKKSLIELAKESVELAGKAQSKKLKREEMTGGCFTISSLGSIGGTAFTPIVNAPEVAILGVSKAQMKPVWDGTDFAPRLMMPLCLSYDHRAVNGADAARFTAFLAAALSDIRRLLM
ncbi:pyruvate dehydrogenase complex dihydrolipoyllysine-residue acetyltransferase [Billgrantia gudaonensis]|uniref:Acetyltransferase component of pyruvate dehydrogenase complex n=1 Tax=Billgrantia gudaonensis TaxID=376427 RepID=A0A1G8UDC6_9GAMM|nr:pyruvate dehydrogenase complex dihydrolipoyllysine-residue acetyltransferase [Halomonas gudaonensis]SDJ51732.1 pyruvate dehydrogenase E2 component (dihydrolipoamide acetyltransferase) [Halomonas gudaonensis]